MLVVVGGDDDDDDGDAVAVAVVERVGTVPAGRASSLSNC